jgi:hypothetical protein
MNTMINNSNFYFRSIEIPFIVFGIQDLVTAIWSYTCLKAYDAEQAKIKK